MGCHTSNVKHTWASFHPKTSYFWISNNKIFYCFITACHVMPLLYNITPLFLTTSVQTKSILSRPDDLMCIKDYLFKYIFVYYIHSGVVEWAQVNFICLHNVCIFDVVTPIKQQRTPKIHTKYVPKFLFICIMTLILGLKTQFRTSRANIHTQPTLSLSN